MNTEVTVHNKLKSHHKIVISGENVVGLDKVVVHHDGPKTFSITGCTFEVTVVDKKVPTKLYCEVNGKFHKETSDTFTVTIPHKLCSLQKGPVADPTVNVTIGDENPGDPE